MTKRKYNTDEERLEARRRNGMSLVKWRQAHQSPNLCLDRKLAISQGRKFYISPTSCGECGGVVKYVSSYGCHFCVKKKGYGKLMSGALDE